MLCFREYGLAPETCCNPRVGACQKCQTAFLPLGDLSSSTASAGSCGPSTKALCPQPGPVAELFLCSGSRLRMEAFLVI